MICGPCQQGGELTARKAANPRYRQGTINRDIQKWHEQCKGGTWCDCQHGNTTVLNQALTKAADVGHGAAEE